MRYRHILAALAEPQLVTPTAAASVLQIILARLDSVDVPTREGQGPCGELIEVQGISIEDGVATITVAGMMGSKLTGMEKGSGAVDTLDIINELDFAEAEPSVNSIILDFDTPGGMYQGTPELGMAINSCAKPVIGFVRNAHSAGYWAASCCDAVLMTPSASAGSIGVYVGFMDVTEALKMRGMKAELFTSGPYKGMGFPGVPLSDAQRELLQSRVMRMNNEFQTHVRAMRGEVADSTMQGQTFGADECLELGLCDEVVDGMEDAVELAQLMGGKTFA